MRRRALGLLAVALVAAGCSAKAQQAAPPPPETFSASPSGPSCRPLSADEQSKLTSFDPLLDEVQREFKAVYQQASWGISDPARFYQEPDGYYLLSATRYAAYGSSSASHPREQEIIDSVLTKHGFPRTSGTPGAKTPDAESFDVSSTNSDGARFRAFGRFDVKLLVELPAPAGACG